MELLGDRELYLENYKGFSPMGKRSSMWMAGRVRGSRGGTGDKAMRERELRIFGWVSKLEIL